MKHLLIADCGSTKIEWAITPHGGNLLHRPVTTFKTTGFNAAVTPPSEISRILNLEVAPSLDGLSVDRLYFYGAGCIGGEVDNRLRHLLYEILPDTEIEIAGDLIGAARALFGDSRGIACILGTGSNCGVYDGQRIVANTPPMGYILGDEGSGAVLGRQLVNHIFKHPGRLSAGIIDDFHATFNLTKELVIERVYRHPAANRFLASLCPFLKKHICDPMVEAIVLNAFREFLSANLTFGDDSLTKLPIGFVGSIAYYFEEQLTKACEHFGLQRPFVMRAPIESLSAYHCCH